MYDSSLSGESITAPHLRTAPFRKDHFFKLANAVMTARFKALRDSGSKLANGDVFLFHDAGKPSTIDAVHKALIRDKGRFAVVAKSENLAKFIVHVCLAEESLKQLDTVIICQHDLGTHESHIW